MLTSKQRAQLRSLGAELDTVLQIGKGGITENVIRQADEALQARELIKGRVLENSMLTAREVCDLLCQATGAEGIQVVGTKFVLYRPSKKPGGGTAKAKHKKNPVRSGAQARRRAAKAQREQRNEYFRQQAMDAAIAKRKER